MTTLIPVPTSRVRFGHARVDITPPVGIYHRMWGAAKHDRASGVHRPLFADVMAFGPADGPGPALVRAQLDLCGLVEAQYDDMIHGMAEGAEGAAVLITFSHTHSSGWFAPDRFALPGGDLIPAYLQDLRARLKQASAQAVAGMAEAILTYGAGRCAMAANRDGDDRTFGGRVCGHNPDAPADDTVLVARISTPSGALRGTMVNYACHPTTLAWENSLISPDYVGAVREVVEEDTDAPCVFLQGACGDLGPRDGFVGDLEVAERNGRQLGFAALSALAGIGPPLTDFSYQGPVISGATLGTWAHTPFSPERLDRASRFSGGTYETPLPLKPLPDRQTLERDMETWETRHREALAAGQAVAARDARARAERARRWLTRLQGLPEGPACPVPFSVYRMGDAVWVTSGGEPYNFIQRELRRRFPQRTILFSPLASGLGVAYLLKAEAYGKGLYQEEPSPLAPGCLERLTEAISGKIAEVAL